jgi:DNA-3-methyladenine glycosylase I
MASTPPSPPTSRSSGAVLHEDGLARCSWAGRDPLYVAYHDTEWGMPEWDDRALFEKLILDGFQAGLSWITILRKRNAFRSGFDGFAPDVIARYGEEDVARLMADAGIVRNRAKIINTIATARFWLAEQERGGFAKLVWGFVEGVPVQNRFETAAQVPTETEASRAMSRHLRSQGLNFCGPTILYAFMQAVGMVNDHLTGCHRHAACAAVGRPAS